MHAVALRGVQNIEKGELVDIFIRETAADERIVKYSADKLKLGAMNLKGNKSNFYYLSASFEKQVYILAIGSETVQLENVKMNKLEGDSASNIKTLKTKGGDIKDISDKFLTNLE